MIISAIKGTFLYYSSLLLLVFAINISAQTGEWINSGPPGYGSLYVTSISPAPGNPDILYTSTSSGVFKSKNRGFSWEPPGLVEKYIQKVMIHPENPDIVYAGSYWLPELYKSTNSGETWFTISPQPDIGVTEIEIVNSQPNVIFAGTKNIIWKSTDEGSSWDSVFVNPGVSEFNKAVARQIKVSQSNPDIIYASFTIEDYSPRDNYEDCGIYISYDGGKSWKRKVNGFPYNAYAEIYSLAVHPLFPRVAYCGTAFGEIYRTLDAGENWQKVSKGLPPATVFYWLTPNSIIFNNEKPSIIYIAFSGESHTAEIRGIYRSTDSGNNWSKFPLIGMHDTKITCLLSNSSGYAEEIYAGTENGGIFKYYEDNALPVELSSFTASYTGNMKVELVWTTASEKNNLGFSIERRNQNLSWTEIGFVKGKGTTAEESKYYFEDHLTAPGYYLYRLKQTDMDGSIKYLAEKEVQVYHVSKFALEQNYPNPFNPQTTIKFSLPEDGFVTLKLYDASGAEASILINEYREAGEHNFSLSSRDLASGVYIYKIDINTSTGKKYSSARKLTVLK